MSCGKKEHCHFCPKMHIYHGSKENFLYSLTMIMKHFCSCGIDIPFPPMPPCPPKPPMPPCPHKS